MKIAAIGNVDLFTAILFNCLTLGPLTLSSSATPPLKIVQHLPTEGIITSMFGNRPHPIARYSRHHDGIDIANTHATSIFAAAAGRVSHISRGGGYGLMVEIDHGGGWKSRYAHLAACAVQPGHFVFAGAMIGKMGNSGLATGTHLHFELRYHNVPVDPLPFFWG